jgi:hypothetical protein
MSTVERVVTVVLVLLAVGGVVVADFATVEKSLRYWLVMVPVFGVLSMVMTGLRANRDAEPLWPALLRQVLHWSALGAAIGLLFYLQSAGRLAEKDVSLLALLALALTTFLAGVHGDWRFCVVGLILGSAAMIMALFETYRLLILIPIAIVALVVVLRLRREPAEAAGPYPDASPDPTS